MVGLLLALPAVFFATRSCVVTSPPAGEAPQARGATWCAGRDAARGLVFDLAPATLATTPLDPPSSACVRKGECKGVGCVFGRMEDFGVGVSPVGSPQRHLQRTYSDRFVPSRTGSDLNTYALELASEENAGSAPQVDREVCAGLPCRQSQQGQSRVCRPPHLLAPPVHV